MFRGTVNNAYGRDPDCLTGIPFLGYVDANRRRTFDSARLVTGSMVIEDSLNRGDASHCTLHVQKRILD
jgi:hypothetical protein